MSNLAAVAIFKNEAIYLPEWLEFHRLVGVEHFYLYNNGSTDAWSRALSHRDHDVTVIPCPGQSKQLPAYADALERFGAFNRWMAFLDIDEFLFSPTGLRLDEILREFDRNDVAGVVANWQVYGTSGLAERPALAISAFEHRAATDNPINRHVKSIVRPRFVGNDVPSDPHHFRTVGVPMVNERNVPVAGPFSDVSVELLRINHYHSRSVSEAWAKAEVPRADNGELRSLESIAPDDYNAEFDDIADELYGSLLERRLIDAGQWDWIHDGR